MLADDEINNNLNEQTKLIGAQDEAFANINVKINSTIQILHTHTQTHT